MNIYLTLDKSSGTPLTKQVYLCLKEKILSGDIKSGEKLPSTRLLAESLSVSRNVALNAYAQLLAEGYLYSKDRSGIFVVEGINIARESGTKMYIRKETVGLQFEKNKNIIDFRTGVPNLGFFPKNQWGRIYRQVCMDVESQNLDYYEPCGSYELRYRLAEYLKRIRGVSCSPENIIITSGAAQSFSLLAQYFSKINRDVIAEDPMSSGITKILGFFDMNIHPVPVDSNGINTGMLPRNISPGLIFTTPSHQFPTGAVLPMSRRARLIDYAKRTGALIVEDDYESEFRFTGYPIQSMQSLAPSSIAYVGTFSKTLCPALRIGYMILPDRLLDEIKSIKYIDDLHSPVLEQLTLARFIEEGLLDRHVLKSRKHYAEKCEHLIKALKETFGDRVRISGHSTGIHLTAEFDGFSFTGEFLENLRQKGVNITSAKDHAIVKGKYESCLLFGFGNLDKSEITQGVMILGQAMYDKVY